MSYKTIRYQQGLSGKKPGWVTIDKEGHQAQEVGYRDYLRNQDLANQIRQANETGSSDHSSYESTPAAPLSIDQRLGSIAIGVVLLFLDFKMTTALIGTGFFPSGWFDCVLIFVLIPGGILFLPAVILIETGLSK
jgi:hypothetical protein